MTQPIISVRDLTVALPPGGDRPEAISAVSFDLAAGEVLCIVGESGSGKSIAASTIMGLLPKRLPVTSGSVTFEGQDILGLSAEAKRSLRGRRVAMIFQEPMTALNPIMPIGRQIAEVMEAHDVGNPATRRARALELLANVGIPDPARTIDTYPFRLSGGQRQRVMIAMALALEPAVLIADEPTTALDVTTQAQILRLIRDLQATKGTGVLFITHDFGVVADIADRVAVMSKGRIVEIGSRDEVLNQPRHPYTQRLIAAVPHFSAHARQAVAAPPLLDIKDVSKVFHRGGFLVRRSEVKAVNDASLVVARGETVGLVGESGSGKSTLARCVVRLYDPSAGSILFDGTDIAQLGKAAIKPLRKKIQMVFQDPFASLNPRRRVGDIIAEGPITHGVARATALGRARELLGLVGLDAGAIDRFPHEFSGGQRQRIGLARALALEPDLLVADEPVSALDVSVQAQVLDLISDLKARLGLTMLFITHDLRVAAQICDRIAVMKRGEIVELGPTAEVFANPRHAYTRELLAAIPGQAWEATRQAGVKPAS
ncbi:ABC transporter ATP-binding protein [Phreatobacter sp. AB_2022a]|uniref:ABC transporter ATP-binding protein n=1 Tax=Phreatobacter sp. AB_2022a TaxID=3003134 RepID=UPI0022876055|nr:ABC transporter ATP-binding protein [Phreatobacter sp. AB_2022a]MCZ0736728.1 ABC transporter ATP-binding protein [Phreatobacter sp. AB_2022a]